MKRWCSIVLVLVIALCLGACGTQTEPVETTAGKDYSQWAGIVEDPAAWVEEFKNLPIANDKMSTDELRQLCVDAFKVNLSFKWTPNQKITYNYTLLEKNRQVELDTGIAYAGLCYATGQSSGNAFKILEYYDEKTGVLDVEEMGGNFMGIITSACARGAEQAWNRVSDSHNLRNMSSFNQYSANVVPVGPYTYKAEDYKGDFGSRTATAEIIAVNSRQDMLESYAAMLPGDGLYSSSSWHVMMCSAKPEVVRDAAGNINPAMSYLLVCEQDAVGTLTDEKMEMQENGKMLCTLGTIDKKYTFQNLLSSEYIPFTLKEFIGEDPVEPGEVWLSMSEQDRNTAPEGLTMAELAKLKMYTNYALCSVEVQVKDTSGNVVNSYKPDIHSLPVTHDVSLNTILDPRKYEEFANGTNTVHLFAQLANGEVVEAYTTVLKLN